ncbi:hypothetical protein [Bradyrhizobium lupini]|uniref:hypothetical protein n=1 Tax=Rhizobium lupini TaxID=136996 RepID=UPI0034C66DFA
MKFVLASLAVLASIAPAMAQTPEKTATTIGEASEGFARSHFLCLSKGVRMPTWEELHPGSAAVLEAAKRDYPEFYKLGAEKGIAQANDTLSDDDTAVMFCKMILQQALKSAGQ